MALNLGEMYFQLGARTAGIERANRELNTLDTRSNLARGAILRLGTAIAAVGFVELGRRAIISADNFNVLQQRIRTATAATGDYIQVSRELFGISQRTGTALASNVDLYQSIARIAPELGVTNAQVLKFSEALGQLGVIGGSNMQQMNDGLRQLSQGLAGGIVRAEEWNSIVENMPEVAARIAKGMGTTIGQLRKIVLAGELTSDKLFESIMKQTEDIGDEFDKMANSVGRSWQKLKDSASRYLAQMDKIGGVTTKISEHMNALAEAMNAGNAAWVQDVINFASSDVVTNLGLLVGGAIAFNLAVGAIRLAFMQVGKVGTTVLGTIGKGLVGLKTTGIILGWMGLNKVMTTAGTTARVVAGNLTHTSKSMTALEKGFGANKKMMMPWLYDLGVSTQKLARKNAGLWRYAKGLGIVRVALMAIPVIANPITWVVAGTAAVGLFAKTLLDGAENATGFERTIFRVWEDIKAYGRIAGVYYKWLFSLMPDWWKDTWSAIGSIAKAGWTYLREGFGLLTDWMGERWGVYTKQLAEDWDEALVVMGKKLIDWTDNTIWLLNKVPGIDIDMDARELIAKTKEVYTAQVESIKEVIDATFDLRDANKENLEILWKMQDSYKGAKNWGQYGTGLAKRKQDTSVSEAMIGERDYRQASGPQTTYGAIGGDGYMQALKDRVSAMQSSLSTELETQIASYKKQLAEVDVFERKRIDTVLSYGEMRSRIEQDHADKVWEIKNGAMGNDLNAIRNALKSEEEVLRDGHIDRLTTLRAALDAESLTEQDYYDLKLKSQEEYQAALAELRNAESNKKLEALNQDVNGLRNSLRTELEVIQDSYDQRLDIISTALDEGVLKQAEAQGMMLRLTKQYAKDAEEAQYGELDAGLASIRQQFMSEAQVYNTAHDKKMEILNEALAQERISIEEHHKLVLELEQAQSDKMKELYGTRYSSLNAEQKMYAAFGLDIDMDAARAAVDNADNASDETIKKQSKAFQKQLSEGAKHSKAAFRLNKAMAMSTALVKMPEAAMSAMAFGTSMGGPALGAAFMTASIALSAGQIAQINSTEFKAGKASGGAVAGGGLYPVNERGPEMLTTGGKDYLMMGAKGGSVTPNHKLGGKGEVEVNVYVNNNVAGVDAQVKQTPNDNGSMDIEVLVERIENTIAGGIARGGSAVSNAIEGVYGSSRSAGSYN